MRKPKAWIVALAAGVLVLVVALAVLPRLGEPPDSSSLGDPLRVAILSPRPGSPTTIGLPIEIQVSAFGSHPLTALELWVDGALAEALYPPAEPPATHLPMSFVWIPENEGPHTLVARVIDVRQGSAESNSVRLIVGPRTLIEENKGGAGEANGAFAVGGGGQGTSAEAGPAVPLSQPPSMPEEGDTSPGTLFSGSWLPAWIGSWFESDPPMSPEIAGAADGCAVNLAIHDLSENEDGFRVYRKPAGEVKWGLVAELAGQSEAEYLTHSTDVSPGDGWYRAESFNADGQAASLPLWIGVSSTECPGDNLEAQTTEVALVDLKSGIPAEQAYCYASAGGSPWHRLPGVGFFPATPGGFDAQHVIASLNMEGVGGKPSSPIETLDLECWGWAGATLRLLGQLHFDFGSDDQGVFETSSDLLSAAVQIMPVYQPLGGDADDLPSVDDFAVGGDPNLPYTFALVTDNVENCKAHTPSEGENLLENLLFCTPFPEFAEGDQPYLTWWLIEGACPAGKDDACYGMAELQQAIDEQGGKFGFTVYDCDKTGLCYLHRYPFDLTAFVIPPFTTCGEPRYFVAQFNLYLGPGDDPALSGPGSPPFAYSIPCPEAYETEGFVLLDVGFESLTIGNADDDDGDGSETVELFGKFEAHTSSDDDSRQLNLGSWGYSSADCPGNETFSPTLSTGGVDSMPECPRSLEDGVYPLSEFMLCQSDSSNACYLWPEDSVTDYAHDNNHFEMRVLEGNAVVIEVVLIDYDSGSANDTACHIVFTTPNWPLETWSGFSDAEFTGSQGDNGHASCAVKVSFTAVGP